MLVEICNYILTDSKTHATLLNCWKFLRAYLYQVERVTFFDGSCDFIYANYTWGMVIIKLDVTMDNQQPSFLSNLIQSFDSDAVHRLR